MPQEFTRKIWCFEFRDNTTEQYNLGTWYTDTAIQYISKHLIINTRTWFLFESYTTPPNKKYRPTQGKKDKVNFHPKKIDKVSIPSQEKRLEQNPA